VYPRILEPLITCIYDEGEKCTKKRKSESFGGLLGSLGEVTQERQDLLRGQGFRFPITELEREFSENESVVPARVFFRVHPGTKVSGLDI